MYLNIGYAPSGRLRAGDNNPRVGAQQVGAEQTDSQLMMADQRGLRSFDALRSERALFEGDQPGIEQQEIDRLTPLDQLGEGGLNAGRRVQIELQRREDFFLGLSRELSSRLLDLCQPASGNDDLLIALGREQAGCRITEPGRGAGNERETNFS